MRVVCYVCPLTAFNLSWLKILTRIITAWQKRVLACDHSNTEVRAIPNTRFYGKFQCKSDPLIRNSDPDKRRTFA